MTVVDPDRALALLHAPPAARPALAAAWAVDERLAAITLAAREPALGIMRLVWWRDALAALAERPPPAEPLLIACAAAAVDATRLADVAEGWESVLDDPDYGDGTVARYARMRGAGLFALAGASLGTAVDEADRLATAGEGWALADLARLLDGPLGRPERAAAIRAGARGRLDAAMARRWPRALRPLGELAALARADCGASPPGPRRRALIVLRHQVTGR